MLRTESDTAARLRKGNTEMSKSLSQVESLNRELQERCRVLESTKLQVEKDYYQLQAALESERRDRSHGSEMIGELQGNSSVFILYRKSCDNPTLLNKLIHKGRKANVQTECDLIEQFLKIGSCFLTISELLLGGRVSKSKSGKPLVVSLWGCPD